MKHGCRIPHGGEDHGNGREVEVHFEDGWDDREIERNVGLVKRVW